MLTPGYDEPQDEMMMEPQEEMMEEEEYELLKLSDADLAKFKKEIQMSMMSWTSAVSTLKTSWDSWEAMYSNDPHASGVAPKNFEDRWIHYPLVQPHIRALVASMMQAVTGHTPWVQMVTSRDTTATVPDDEMGQREMSGVEVMSEAADLIHSVLMKHGALHILKKVLKNAFIQGGRGILHLEPGDDDDAILAMNVIDGRNFCFDPPYIQHLWDERILMMGHRESMPVVLIRERIARGEYYDVQVSPSQADSESMRVSSHSPVAMGDEDSQTEQVWTIYKKCSLKEGDEVSWYKVIGCGQNAETILAVYRHELSYLPYIDFSEEPENNKFYKAGSIAGGLSPIQHSYTNAMNTLDLGNVLQAFPPMLGIGLGDKEPFPLEIGMVHPVPHGIDLQVIQIPFNPGSIPMLIEKFEEIAGTITGTSRAGTGGELSHGTTATEAQGYFNAQSRTEQGYINDLAASFERLFATVHAMLLQHPSWAEKILYGIAEKDWATILQTSVGCRYALAANMLTNGPMNRQQLVQALLPLTQDPEFGIDKHELGKFIIDTMADGQTKRTLQKPKEEVNAQLQQQAEFQLAQMAQNGRGGGDIVRTGDEEA
jgi:hypothetical protein